MSAGPETTSSDPGELDGEAQRATSETPPREPSLSPADPGRGLARALVGSTVFGVVVFAALSFYGDLQALLAHLAAYRWSAFGLGLALATANYALRFLRWELYLRILRIRLDWIESARIFVAGFVMSITPGKVGEVFKSYLLYETHGVSMASTAPIVIAERLTDLFALVILAVIGATALPEGYPVAITGGVFVLALWAACAFRPLGELCLGICERLPLLGKLAPRLREAYEALHSLVGPGVLLGATALATLSWFLECVALLVIAEGFVGAQIGWLEAIFAYSVPTILGALTMLPGGLGATEASMTGVLVRAAEQGMTTSVATGATMLVRIATLWWAVILGLLALIWHRAAPRPRVLHDPMREGHGS